MRFFAKTNSYLYACALGVFIVFFYLQSLLPYGYSDRAADLELPGEEPSSSSFLLTTYKPDLCSEIRNLTDVTIIVKSGATELWEKIPGILLSNLACADDVLIYSDIRDEHGGTQVFDALENIPENLRATNEDFNLYRLQQEYRNDRAEITDLKKDHGQEAWKLDRYKSVHTLEGAFKQSPNSSWYFFIDADTYIVWSSLLPWLKMVDPSEKLYIGSAAYFGETPFAHGGSGYILSQAAMRHYNERTGSAKNFYNMSRESCCGDLVVGELLAKSGIKLTNSWPMFNGENGRTIPFGSNPYGYAEHWCEPVVTMHHILPREISNFWKYEESRKPGSGPILFKELYEHLTSGHDFAPKREDWNNFSKDDPPEGKREQADQSFEECGKVCAAEDGCFQYLYSGNKCKLSMGMVVGERAKSPEGAAIRSGWNLDRWEMFKQKRCDEPNWILNRPLL